MITDKEKLFCNISDMNTISVLRFEVGFIKKYFQSNKDQAIKQILLWELKQIQDFLRLVPTAVQSQKLTVEKYKEFQKNTIQKQQQLLEIAGKLKSQFYEQRIKQRLEAAKQEMVSLHKDPKYFQHLMQLCNDIAPQQQAQNKQVDYTELANLLDKKYIQVKMAALAKRYKQYSNLAVYFKTHMAEEKSSQLAKIIQYLGTFKQLVELLSTNPQQPIGKFLIEEAVEISVPFFQGMDLATYKKTIQNYQTILTQCLESEKEFKKQTQNAIRRGQAVNPLQESQERLNLYMTLRKYFMDIQKSPFTPFPMVKIQKEEERELILCNKDITPHTLEFRIIRLLNCKNDKFQISWSFQVNNQVYSEKTDYCDSSNVFNYKKQITIGDKKNVCYGLHEKQIQIQMVSKGFFGHSEYSQGIISLENLKSNCTDVNTITMKHKSHTFQLEYGLFINEAEYPQQFKVPSIQVIKYYPEFNPDEGVKETIDKYLATIPQELIQEALKQKQQEQSFYEQQKMLSQQQQSGTSGQGGSKVQLINLVYIIHTAHPDHEGKDAEFVQLQSLKGSYPQGLTDDDVLKPDDPVRNPSYGYSKMYLPIMDNYITNNSVRVEKRISKKIQEELMRIDMTTPQKIQNGTLSIDDYIESLQQIQKRDKILQQFYMEKNCKIHHQFVTARLQIIGLEIQEANGGREEEEEKQDNSQAVSQQKMEVEVERKQSQSHQSQKLPQKMDQQEEDVMQEEEQQLQAGQLSILEHSQSSQAMQILLAIQQEELPNFLKKDDVLMPDNPENNQCLNYLIAVQPIFEQGIEKFTNDINLPEKKTMKKLLESAKKAQAELMKQGEDGVFDLDEYAKNINQMIKRDQFLAKFYVQKGLKQWSDFVLARIKICKDELQGGQ